MGYLLMIGLVLGSGAGAVAQEQGEVHPAVLWERAKSATAKQVNNTSPAETKPEAASKPGDGNEADAVRWERTKDRAAKRQMDSERAAQSRNASAKPKK